MSTRVLQSNIWRDFFNAMAESWNNLKDTTACSSFLVCKNRSRSALVRELLSNTGNSPFVGQLKADESVALRTRDLISFTNDLQGSELLLNNSLLELIYFLNKTTQSHITKQLLTSISIDILDLSVRTSDIHRGLRPW